MLPLITGIPGILGIEHEQRQSLRPLRAYFQWEGLQQNPNLSQGSTPPLCKPAGNGDWYKKARVLAGPVRPMGKTQTPGLEPRPLPPPPRKHSVDTP